MKFLAEQQYFNKDKTSTENPVKVCKSLYQAFGVALALQYWNCYEKLQEKYQDDPQTLSLDSMEFNMNAINMHAFDKHRLNKNFS